MAYTPLAAGVLTKRITIQSLTQVDDGGGGKTNTWADGVTCWASIEPGAGREFSDAKQQTPELSHVVTVRYRAVTPKNRIKYVSNAVTRVFNVRYVQDPGERHEQLVLYCSEVVPT
jgi:SPP1 family predicted phage head-tail adaptor